MKIKLKRSNVLDNGVAKEPTAAQMEYGELAVNYNKEDPVIFIKNSDNSIIRLTNVNEEVNWNDIVDKPAIPGFDDIPDVYDGQINVNAAVNGGITATGSNATANQQGDTERLLSVDTAWLTGWINANAGINDARITIKQPGAADQSFTVNQLLDQDITLSDGANDGLINIDAGDGIVASGDNASANQSGDTTRLISLDLVYTDNRYVNKTGDNMTGNLTVATDKIVLSSDGKLTATVFDLESLDALPE